MISITFRQLEVFVQLVECGGASACAEKLGISQVSVNEHLKALEGHCGTTLILRRRGARGILTDAGEQTYRRALALLQDAHTLTTAFSDTWREGARRKIRMAAHELIAERIGGKLAKFMSTFPTVDLEQERRSFEGVLQGLRDGELELGFFLSFGPVPELESFCAGHEEVAFYVAETHPLARTGAIDPLELAGYPFIHLPARTHLRKQLDALMRSIGLSGEPVAMTGESFTLALETAAKGSAVVCLFANMPQEPMRSRGLQRVKLTCDLPQLDVRYAIRAPFHHDALVNQLTTLLSSDTPEHIADE